MKNAASFQWDDRLNLGVPAVDKDHKRLFSIIKKILTLSNEEQEERVKHAAKEGIKFFTTYAMEHFAREEALMLSLGYPEFEMHKRIHDDMRSNVLPSLQKDLEESDYSLDSIRHFLGVCVGWLTTHIMMIDQTIVHHDKYKHIELNFGNQEDTLNAVFQKIVENLYHFKPDVVSNHYTGWDFGKALFYEMTYQTEEKKVVHLLFTLEEKAIFTLASQRIGMEIKKVDAYLLALIKEILSNVTTQMAYYLKLTGTYKQRSGVMLESSEVEFIFTDKKLLYSSLFSTPVGKIAFSVYER